ncbi:hypothetical protein OIO90_003479 [Microbotryomycetes sp. JL221]|nr:hypothetical protein OIO90_003479 [Microbotryomycetes sp. JL221]
MPNSSSINGDDYIAALTHYIKRHEHKLASFVNHRHPPSHTTRASWQTILTMGIIVPQSPSSSSSSSSSPSPPLVLKMDPHHLYFTLLKFEQAHIDNIGPLNTRIQQTLQRPMLIQPIPGIKDKSDTISLSSAFSSFSLGSTWWTSSTTTTTSAQDHLNNVRYVYSSWTKLPALELTPFTFPSSSSSNTNRSILSKPIQSFEDCPPLSTAVPLDSFKNLSSLTLNDLDPRGFVGWDKLSLQLKQLIVTNGGIEDVGELVCDVVVEDLKLRLQLQGQLNTTTLILGTERYKRQRWTTHIDSLDHHHNDILQDEHEDDTHDKSYPVPPATAWSQLQHLSLSNNALTFIPSTPMTYLSTLTSLDLSSNLLIAIPPALSSMSSLQSLNLSDNMIDTCIGVEKTLGNVETINLSHNRIENLSGLDKVWSLKRLDLRNNKINETFECSRLSRLPCLKQIWLKGNPFTFSNLIQQQQQETILQRDQFNLNQNLTNWRIQIFNYFIQEGNQDILLDGTKPGFNEKRYLSTPTNTNNNNNNNATFSNPGSYRATHAENTHSRRTASEFINSSSDRTTLMNDNGRNGATMESNRLKFDSNDHNCHHRRIVTSPVFNPTTTTTTTTTTVQDSDSQNDSSNEPIVGIIKSRPRRHHQQKQGKKVKRIVNLDDDDNDQINHVVVVNNDDDDVENSMVQDAIKNSIHSTKSNPFSNVDQRNKDSIQQEETKLQIRRQRVSNSLDESRLQRQHDQHTKGLGKGQGQGQGQGLRQQIEQLRNEVGETWLSVLSEREIQLEQTNK